MIGRVSSWFEHPRPKLDNVKIEELRTLDSFEDSRVRLLDLEKMREVQYVEDVVADNLDLLVRVRALFTTFSYICLQNQEFLDLTTVNRVMMWIERFLQTRYDTHNSSAPAPTNVFTRVFLLTWKDTQDAVNLNCRTLKELFGANVWGKQKHWIGYTPYAQQALSVVPSSGGGGGGSRRQKDDNEDNEVKQLKEKLQARDNTIYQLRSSKSSAASSTPTTQLFRRAGGGGGRQIVITKSP